MQWCDMLDGVDKEKCVENTKEAYEKALKDCYPEDPTDCEVRYETVYAETMEQCLADNDATVDCTPVAEEAA